MSLRHEFVVLAEAPGVTMRALCRRFGISTKTGYKWLMRYREAGVPPYAKARYAGSASHFGVPADWQ